MDNPESATPSAPEAPAPSAPVVATTPLQPVPSGSNKKKVIIIVSVVVGLLLTIGIALIIFFIIAWPGIQARATADGVMDAMTNGDKKALAKFAEEDDDMTFLNTQAKKLDGRSFKITDSKFVEEPKPTYYFMFTATDKKSPKEVRVGIMKNKLASFVLGDDLRLVPKEKESSNDRSATTLSEGEGSTDGTESEAPVARTEGSSQACLTQADLDKASDFKPGFTFGTSRYGRNDFKADGSGGHNPIYSMFFHENTSNYKYETSLDNLKPIVAFYKANPSKNYTIGLQGSVYSVQGTVYGEDLAKSRAERVKSDLVNAGVPASKITILPNKKDEAQDAVRFDAVIYRTVDMFTIDNCVDSTMKD